MNIASSFKTVSFPITRLLDTLLLYFRSTNRLELKSKRFCAFFAKEEGTKAGFSLQLSCPRKCKGDDQRFDRNRSRA